MASIIYLTSILICNNLLNIQIFETNNNQDVKNLNKDAIFTLLCLRKPLDGGVSVYKGILKINSILKMSNRISQFGFEPF